MEILINQSEKFSVKREIFSHETKVDVKVPSDCETMQRSY